MSNTEGPQNPLSKYHLKIEDGNLVPDTRYYLRDSRLTEYETTGKYINFSFYSYFWNDSIIFQNRIPYNYFTAKKIQPTGIHKFYSTIGNYGLFLYSIYSELNNSTRKINEFYYRFGDEISTDYFLNEFIHVCEFLVSEMDENNDQLNNEFSLKQGTGLLLGTKSNKANLIKAPWKSSLAYGVVLSCFSRAYHVTGEEKYLHKSKSLLKGYTEDFNSSIFGKPFYEEYPIKPGHYVLNGFIFALLGLYDFHQISGDEHAKNLFDQGLDTLEAILPIYDLGDGSSYDLQHLHSHTPPYKARWQYHCTHIEQLKTLYLITRNPLFETYYLRFKAYLSGQFTAPL